ncbi:MAG: MAPEG family protein [Henriciella sp.]|nr:MAPEG family protein [Henriciella sp.]
MGFELQAVVWTTVILAALIGFQGGLVPIYQGFAWGLGNRDEAREKTELQLRTARTVANHIEGMMVFIPLALIVAMSDLSSTLTTWGAGLYLLGRVLFAPLYLIGVPYLRSLVWGVSLVGIIMLGFEVVRAAIG